MGRDLTWQPPIPADERVSYGDAPNHFFDAWHPVGTARGSAIFIHGGFWRARYGLTHASHVCAALARHGLATANLEYRRVGDSGGGWPGSYNDVLAALPSVTTHFGEKDVVVLGHSAGGHLALRLAAEPLAIRGIVALAPVADVRLAYDLHLSNDAVVEFLGGTPSEVPAAYYEACPTKHTSAIRRILLHGKSDDVVPISLSTSYCQKRKADEDLISLRALEGVDHFALIDPESPAFTTVLQSVLELLA